MNKQVVTITGIRPDFIRMSEIFKKLDSNFNHILIHTGQHYDNLLSDIFFEELQIRVPDYNLKIGNVGKKHYHQTADLSVKIIELIESEKLNPDIIIFLGDSNSVVSSVSLKKEGFKIGHIEAGMRSYDNRMLEEINRVVCDHCSDYLFVYHNNYKIKAEKENISSDNIFVVGNTIVEIVNKYKSEIIRKERKEDFILMDIHRPENFKYKNRMEIIMLYAHQISQLYKLPIKMLNFKRAIDFIKKFQIKIEDNIEIVDLMSYKNYLNAQYQSKFIISDSGTAQEEACLFGVPVVVPRDYTERPESIENLCSIMININKEGNIFDMNDNWGKSINYINEINNNHKKMDVSWLGDGQTSDSVINIIKRII